MIIVERNTFANKKFCHLGAGPRAKTRALLYFQRVPLFKP